MHTEARNYDLLLVAARIHLDPTNGDEEKEACNQTGPPQKHRAGETCFRYLR